MALEFEGLVAAEAFTIVDSVPPDSNIVNSRWLYKRKADAQGMTAKAKSRLVGRGFSQMWGIY